MTDKELLEAAARAADIDYGWQHIYDDYEGCTSDKWDWNPLKSDGDALRLAVKLGIDITKAQLDYRDKHSKDPYAATRSAIVRAVAATEYPCTAHPDAPHGFNRNNSHINGRYTCDCEGWVPDNAEITGLSG